MILKGQIAKLIGVHENTVRRWIQNGTPDKELTKLLDEETFMNSDRVVQLGFCDEVIDSVIETDTVKNKCSSRSK